MEAVLFIAAWMTSVALGSTGALEGELKYPACTGVPADYVVCAEPTDGGQPACTRDFTIEDGLRYRLSVPPGQYRVFAQADSVRPGYRAYYSEAVRCGLRVGCDDHRPVVVSVSAGAATRSVEPADWFAGENVKGVLAWNR